MPKNPMKNNILNYNKYYDKTQCQILYQFKRLLNMNTSARQNQRNKAAYNFKTLCSCYFQYARTQTGNDRENAKKKVIKCQTKRNKTRIYLVIQGINSIKQIRSYLSQNKTRGNPRENIKHPRPQSAGENSNSIRDINSGDLIKQYNILFQISKCCPTPWSSQSGKNSTIIYNRGVNNGDLTKQHKILFQIPKCCPTPRPSRCGRG